MLTKAIWIFYPLAGIILPAFICVGLLNLLQRFHILSLNPAFHEQAQRRTLQIVGTISCILAGVFLFSVALSYLHIMRTFSEAFIFLMLVLIPALPVMLTLCLLFLYVKCYFQAKYNRQPTVGIIVTVILILLAAYLGIVIMDRFFPPHLEGLGQL